MSLAPRLLLLLLLTLLQPGTSAVPVNNSLTSATAALHRQVLAIRDPKASSAPAALTPDASLAITAAGFTSPAAELHRQAATAGAAFAVPPGVSLELSTDLQSESAGTGSKASVRLPTGAGPVSSEIEPHRQATPSTIEPTRRRGSAVVINSDGAALPLNGSMLVLDDDEGVFEGRLLLSSRDADGGHRRWGVVKGAVKGVRKGVGAVVNVFDKKGEKNNKRDIGKLRFDVDATKKGLKKARADIVNGTKSQAAADHKISGLTAVDKEMTKQLQALQEQDNKFNAAHDKIQQWQTESSKQTQEIMRKQKKDGELIKSLQEQLEFRKKEHRKLKTKVEAEAAKDKLHTMKLLIGLGGGLSLAFILLLHLECGGWGRRSPSRRYGPPQFPVDRQDTRASAAADDYDGLG